MTLNIHDDNNTSPFMPFQNIYIYVISFNSQDTLVRSVKQVLLTLTLKWEIWGNQKWRGLPGLRSCVMTEPESCNAQLLKSNLPGLLQMLQVARVPPGKFQRWELDSRLATKLMNFPGRPSPLIKSRFVSAL